MKKSKKKGAAKRLASKKKVTPILRFEPRVVIYGRSALYQSALGLNEYYKLVMKASVS